MDELIRDRLTVTITTTAAGDGGVTRQVEATHSRLTGEARWTVRAGPGGVSLLRDQTSDVGGQVPDIEARLTAAVTDLARAAGPLPPADPEAAADRRHREMLDIADRLCRAIDAK